MVGELCLLKHIYNLEIMLGKTGKGRCINSLLQGHMYVLILLISMAKRTIEMDLIMRRVSRQGHDGENEGWCSMHMIEFFFLEELRKHSSMEVHLHNDCLYNYWNG
ncbi:uncharacterized protein LOC124676637 isoform X2 [Lolium rigidum]|uniref:uncharacterized protein LOC124676637 isoform X2 n=1 Tax=Lolium rigidum TaxID=89674 RepID=UPI001F5C48F0|nr:uncharacterized protein LOC124676637 isoform X2 [Lolium rigidum]